MKQLYETIDPVNWNFTVLHVHAKGVKKIFSSEICLTVRGTKSR